MDKKVRQLYFSEIVNNVLQAARVKLFGEYTKQDEVYLVNFSQKEGYQKHFLDSALYNAERFLIDESTHRIDDKDIE